jgi:hypothetical protein
MPRKTTPKMQRAHFEFLAAFFKPHVGFLSKALAESQDSTECDRVEACISHTRFLICCLAAELGKTNTRFDRAKFLKACGIDE